MIMTLHRMSDQYWTDRQRDLTRPSAVDGLVNSITVTDRGELPSMTIFASALVRRVRDVFGKKSLGGRRTLPAGAGRERGRGG